MEKPNLIIYGRVIAVSGVTEVPSKDAGKQAIKKQSLYVDCTRYDSLTGERMNFENKPVIEFGGDKPLDKIKALALQKGDVVCIRFDIQGSPYTDEKTGKTKVFTAVRGYDVDVVRRAEQQQTPQQPQQPQQAQPQEPVQTSQDGTDGLPF